MNKPFTSYLNKSAFTRLSTSLLSVALCLTATSLLASTDAIVTLSAPIIAQTTQDRATGADRLLLRGIQQLAARQPEAALNTLEQTLQIAHQ
ncbi:MAG TPA: hypothetical protein IGS53_13715 [Leptolyngbyaceae cyanobacterium M33_DOE_097]|uniref:Tetratricopeptide repeat protein n=1 Tax=Oscillatoriales cyanobacterium SpSt-418 TaxID=2282169 RepID=A0A7C3PEJ1_9CYAN|nr:hypothetical protein [Leptolyngbyaceae cyanobacterium M33_DOE_097]